MSQITKPSGLPPGRQGFTLVELLVVMAIFGALSLVSVQLLWDTLSTRSKQYSIENSTAAVRPVVNALTLAVISADAVDIATNEVKITGTPCTTIRLDTATKTIEQASDPSMPCVPPSGGFSPLTPPDVAITAFTLSPVGTAPKEVTVHLAGTYKDSIGSHNFVYDFSVSPRVAL